MTKPPVKNPETASFTYEPNEFEETCGEYLGTGFIIGGETTKQGEIPYIAALGYRNANGKIYYNCAGTLINRYIFYLMSPSGVDTCLTGVAELGGQGRHLPAHFFGQKLQKLM